MRKANNRPVYADDIDLMVSAATELHGALMKLIGCARTKGFESDQLDPLTLREGATELLTLNREVADIAILMMAEAREIERRRQLENVVKKGGKS